MLRFRIDIEIVVLNTHSPPSFSLYALAHDICPALNDCEEDQVRVIVKKGG